MAFSDEDPSVRIPLDRLGEAADEGAIMIPFKDINLQPGTSCVDQFKKFFGTVRMEDHIRVSQENNVINMDDPYIQYLLEKPERVTEEIKSLETYIRTNAAILMPIHQGVLSNFIIFLKRVQICAEFSNPENAVMRPLDKDRTDHP